MQSTVNLSNDRYKDWEWARQKALTNLFWFETVVCAQAWSDKFHDFGYIQKLMCAFLQDDRYRRKFLSAFRLSLKTTVLMGFCVWLFCLHLVRKQAVGTIYNTFTKDNAYNFSSEFKQTILENDYLHWLVPELPSTEGKFDQMTKGRVRHKNVIMDFASVETSLVSRHYPNWINDDLENDKNVLTEGGRASLHRDWKYQKAILTKLKKKGLGLEVDVGTPYHFDGLIWSIRNNPTYKKLIIPYKNPDGTLTFPELYTEADFEEKRQDMGASIFSAQFELKPISEEGALCREGWVKYWRELPEFRWRSMVCDPGGAEPGDNDPTGITIVDTDVNGDMYVVYAEQMWLTPMNLMDTIVKLRIDYEVDDVRIEKEKYSTTIADMYKHRFPLMNISFVEHKGRAKAGPLRIWRLKQWFESKRIYIGSNQKTFEEQLLQYPHSKYDDILDSLSYHLDIRRTPVAPKPHRLPSGKIFDPNVESTFDREFDEMMMNMKERDTGEARHNDKYF